jgi:hypothetical protein
MRNDVCLNVRYRREQGRRPADGVAKSEPIRQVELADHCEGLRRLAGAHLLHFGTDWIVAGQGEYNWML